MTIEVAEKLKKEWTDKFVVVVDGVPELRRFVGLTGTVKTVNMNCKVLVQFDSPEDISWYDIDPAYLKTVAAPQPKKAAAHAEAAKPAAAKPAAAAKKPGLSPLEMARQQGAAGSAPAKAAAPAKTDAPKGEGKKLSPLELARQQGAAGKAAAAPPKAAAPAEGKKLSPLELARQQGAAGSGAAAKGKAPKVEEPAAEEAAEPAPAAPAKAKPAEAPKAPATAPDGKKLSPLELARQQGAFKG